MSESIFKKNIDFLRSLSVDELALVINHPCNCCVYEDAVPLCVNQDVHCCDGVRQWLNRPYEGNPLSESHQEMLKEAREGRMFGEDTK